MLKELFQLLYLKHCNFEKSLFLCHDHHIFSMFFILHISPRQSDSVKYVLSQNARLCMCTHSTVFVVRVLIDLLWFVGLSSMPELKSSPASCCPNSCSETLISLFSPAAF